MVESQNVQQIYERRYEVTGGSDRDRVWKILCSEVFQRYVPNNGTVLDLAAGACEFINNIEAGRKIAVDLNPDIAAHAKPGVETYSCEANELDAIEDGTCDVVFTSNFFEHLDSGLMLIEVLTECSRVLKCNGMLIVLQPNIDLLGSRYWDFIDHSLALNKRSMCEALELSGFKMDSMKERFLPYTMQSRLPTIPTLVRLYLKLKPAQWLMGKQSLFIAKNN